MCYELELKFRAVSNKTSTCKDSLQCSRPLKVQESGSGKFTRRRETITNAV